MPTQKYRYCITPGTMGAAGLACKMFGTDFVETGEWLGPVYVRFNDGVRMDSEIFEVAKLELAEHELTITEEFSY